MDTQSWTNSQTYISVLMQALLLVCWARSGSPALCSVISGCWWEYWAPVCSYSCIHECIPSVMFSALTKVCASASFTSSLFKVLGMPVCVCVWARFMLCVCVCSRLTVLLQLATNDYLRDVEGRTESKVRGTGCRNEGQSVEEWRRSVMWRLWASSWSLAIALTGGAI